MLKKIFVDGRAFPNDSTGQKFIGICLVDGGDMVKILDEIVRETGIGTNNEAEYEACIGGLMFALKKGFKDVLIYSDSMLVIKQLSGEWRHDPKFSKYIDEYYHLKNKFNSVKFEYVKSEGNLAHGSIERFMDNYAWEKVS